jgi:L-amino acid N-acyltransferase YncA
MSAIEYRIAHADDARAIADIYAPYVRETIVSFETEPPDANEIAQRIRRIGWQYPWLAAASDGQLIGYAYACENRARLAYRWSVDTAVYLHPSAQRQGFGHGLYQRLFAFLRKQGYVNAFAGISLPNDASVRLHETMGFRPIGVYRRVGYKLGGWRDVSWWQLALHDPPADPAEPLAFESLDTTVISEILVDGAAH